VSGSARAARLAVLPAAAVLLAPVARVRAQGVCPSPSTIPGARRLPAVFDEGRVLLAPVSPRGDTTIFILDSGGGFNAMSEPRLAQLGIASHVEGTGTDTLTVVPIAAFGDSMQLPVPNAGYPGRGLLAVTKELRETPAMYAWPVAGFLGGGFWADRVWRIDYLHNELWLYPRSVLPPAGAGTATPSAHVVPLHFLVKDGKRPTNFARIRGVIDGDTLDLLFDTGATTLFSDSAMAIVADGRPAGRAGSFAPADVFDRWHAHHPEWRVIERGEMGRQALIEVPAMELGGWTIGPVWWERRNTAPFHRLMDPLMDQPIQGSVGGAAFRYLTITIDYPNAMACFER
jgi:hypothetical protein